MGKDLPPSVLPTSWAGPRHFRSRDLVCQPLTEIAEVFSQAVVKAAATVS